MHQPDQRTNSAGNRVLIGSPTEKSSVSCRRPRMYTKKISCREVAVLHHARTFPAHGGKRSSRGAPLSLKSALAPAAPLATSLLGTQVLRWLTDTEKRDIICTFCRYVMECHLCRFSLGFVDVRNGSAAILYPPAAADRDVKDQRRRLLFAQGVAMRCRPQG